METLIPIINDISVIIFNLILFVKMVRLRRDKTFYRLLMVGGCAVIVGAYFTATYILKWAASVSTLICMTIPSMLLFLYLSNCRDSRFFLTFCFVDTVSLIIAFISRYIGILTGFTGGIIGLLVTDVLYIVIIWIGNPYFKKYTELLDVAKAGWTGMMLASFLIYFALIFFAAYPEPLVNRVEYGLVYLVFCAVVLSCYTVFIHSIVKTRKIYEQYCQLQQEKIYHKIAYTDVLTQLGNRASYVEKINGIQRNLRLFDSACCVVLDINNFKKVNDVLGHHAGDAVLVYAARLLKEIFCGEAEEVFRIGGDEFFILSLNCTESEIQEKVGLLEQKPLGDGEIIGVPVTFAAGYAFAEISESGEDTLEKAFIRADRMMYQHKQQVKGCTTL